MIIRYRSYAKLNLYLDVLNRRRDGFHNIETIFQTIGLHDELTFIPAPEAITLGCTEPCLPTGPDNLVVRAAQMLRHVSGTRKGATIHLEKRIPLAAGLAGGSGNAAATLVALNRLWALGLSPFELAALGLRLGSDVPYCLRGGTMVATGRGERLDALPSLRDVWYVLAHPPLEISARDAYGNPQLTRNLQRPFAGKTPGLRRALRSLRDHDYPQLLYNRLAEPLLVDYPALAQLRDALLVGGCEAALVSGSGPTVFGVCSSRDSARRVAEKLEVRATVAHGVPFGIRAVSDTT